MKIMTNYQSLIAQRRLRNVQERIAEKSEKLASGDRITRAAYDPAGLAVSEVQRAKILSLQQVEKNVNSSFSILQITEGTLSSIQSMMTRLRELAIHHASDVIGQRERSFGDVEFQEVKKEIRRATESVDFNGSKLITNDSKAKEFQVGTDNNVDFDRIRYKIKDTLKFENNWGLNGLGVTTKESARDVLEKMDSIIDRVSQGRSVLGAFQERMDSVLSNSQILRENYSFSRSKIRDADIALESAEKASASLHKEAASAVLQQANFTPSKVSKLV